MAIGRIKENFGSNIVRCPTDGPVGPSQVDQLPTPSLNAEHHSLLPLPRKLDQRRQSKIADPQIHLLIQHEVPQFQVAMNDRVGVHVIARADELNEVESSFWFAVAASTAEEVEEGLCSVEERGGQYMGEKAKERAEERTPLAQSSSCM